MLILDTPNLVPPNELLLDFISRCRFCWLLSLMSVQAASFAQPGSRIAGRVVDASAGRPVEGATVVLIGTLFGTVTDDAGRFELGPVPDGDYAIRVIRAGLSPAELRITLPADAGQDLLVRVGRERPPLDSNPFVGSDGPAVVPFRARGDPDLADHRTGLVRVPGVSLHRMSSPYSMPIVDGTPADLSSTLVGAVIAPILEIPGVGHLELLSSVTSRRGGVVSSRASGLPLALQDLAFVGYGAGSGGLVSGRTAFAIDAGYQTNVKVFDTKALLTASRGRAAYRFGGLYSRGADYTSPRDEQIGATFEQWGFSAETAVRLSRRSRMVLGASHLSAGFADLSGGWFDLRSGEASAVSGGWSVTPEGALLRRMSAEIFWTRANATLDDRRGPAPARFTSVDATTDELSVGLAADIATQSLSTFRLGTRISRRTWDGKVRLGDEGGQVLGRHWPDVSQVSLGLFAETAWRGDQVAATARAGLDYQRKEPTDFPDQATVAPLRVRQGLTGGASASVNISINTRWSTTIYGTFANRQPTVRQLYSSQLPAPGAFPAGSLGGNDRLRDQQSYGAGMQLLRESDRTRLEWRPFVLYLDGFVAPDDSTSADYSSGSAVLYGIHMSGRRVLAPFVTVSGFLSFVNGTDRRRSDAMPYFPPFNGRIDLTAEPPGGRLLFEVSSVFAAARKNVAADLGEPESSGHAVFHLSLGFPLSDRLALRLGINNVLNTHHAPHLNPYDRSLQRRIPSPGRTWLFMIRLRS